MKENLKIKTYPLAEKANEVYFKDYRITVLQNRLFRIEKDIDKVFCNEATQKVWYRNMPAQNFNIVSEGDNIKIVTDACELLIAENFNDFRIKIDGVWKTVSNDGNLGGTFRTLDLCKGDEYFPPSKKTGKISLGNGVCSKAGVAYFNDDSLILSDDGMVKARRRQEKDIYVFAYGKNYREAVKALYLITGKPPVIPRFAFGNWWSRYREYTEEEYMQVIERFFEREIPLTVATVDMDWHYSVNVDKQKKITESGKNTEYYGGNSGWTGYSWNKELFPDYKAFLKQLKKRNLKITLNLHPSLGIRWFEDCYPEMARVMGIEPESGKLIEFDMTDEKFIEAYFDVVHKPYEKDGVDFWWIDWQQGESSKLAGFDPLWALNHYHYLDNREGHETPLILSRYADVGSHRYPLGFTGDTAISFETLDYLPYFTATASNIGYTYWSHDIGGHYGCSKENELYLRFVQYAVFNPIMRLHGECNPVSTKEPWYYGAEGVIAEKYLKLRHSLIPFLYSFSKKTTEEGLALCEPMYYSYPEDNRAYEYKNQYMFADQLLVAPVTSRTDSFGYAIVKGYLPKGKWTDIFTGQIYDGDVEYQFVRNVESIPVFAKEGAIIAYSEDKGNGCKNPKNLRIEVYNGISDYILNEDGLRTRFAVSDGKERITLCIDSENSDFCRKLKIVFKNLKKGNVKIYKNGNRIKTGKLYSDYVSVCIARFKFGAKYKIIVEYKELSRIEEKKQAIVEKLMKIEGDYEYRQKIYNGVLLCDTEKEILKIIEYSEFNKTVKKYLKEGL